jgi:hypothetical protein
MSLRQKHPTVVTDVYWTRFHGGRTIVDRMTSVSLRALQYIGGLLKLWKCVIEASSGLRRTRLKAAGWVEDLHSGSGQRCDYGSDERTSGTLEN